jgi:polysaccharide export outer membrane protein
MLAAMAVSGTLLAGCASSGSSLPALPEAASVERAYVLGPGDRLKILVYGAEDVSGEFAVADSGLVAAPLIGQTKAQGLTVAQLEDSLREKLSQGYLRNPRVSVDVLSYRPFSILGEVQHPGTFPYSSGATVLSAIAQAGGYTYRANEDFVVVDRKTSDGKTIRGRATATSRIQPDDIIRVPERYF